MNLSLADALTGAYDRSQLGHALLIGSPQEREASFEFFVRNLARNLSCLSRRAGISACGKCDSCLLFGDEKKALDEISHPDVFWLAPESAVAGYGVDAIRKLSHSFHLRRSLSNCRVAWIRSAESLSASGGASANALLKLLEEPRPDSFLILTSARVDSVLPTIRSRCQNFRWTAPGSVESGSQNVFERRHIWKSDETLQHWIDLLQWIEQGAPDGSIPPTPADLDSFWEERSVAVEELEKVFNELWPFARENLSSGDRDAGQRVLDFFKSFESVIRSVRAYGNAPLQWLGLKTHARFDSYGND